jgi:RNA polymerase sigma-70 factor (ECF subfamily)
MTLDVSIPTAAGDPVAVALNDPAIQNRLEKAARAFLGKRLAELPPGQRCTEAQELVQEAALRALKNRDRFHPSKDVVKWLIGFVINVARELKKKHSRGASALAQDEADCVALTAAPGRHVDSSVVDKLLVDHLLEQLPVTDRHIVLMKYREDMTCAEIGGRIALKETAVRVRLFRTIRKLQELCGVTGEGKP